MNDQPVPFRTDLAGCYDHALYDLRKSDSRLTTLLYCSFPLSRERMDGTGVEVQQYSASVPLFSLLLSPLLYAFVARRTR